MEPGPGRSVAAAADAGDAPAAEQERRVASVARVYDYALGGKDNYAVDREMYARIVEDFPGYPAWARGNRAFMTRAVRRMAEAGVEQFVDLGTGIPTSPNVHEVARAVRPGARVVYVDNDPVVLAHSRALLGCHAGVASVEADVRDVEAVLADERLRATVDWQRPVGLLMIAVLHFLDAPTADRVVAAYKRLLVPGSWLAVSSVTRTNEEAERRARAFNRGGTAARLSESVVPHDPGTVRGWFDGLELEPPGLVSVTPGDGQGDGQGDGAGDGATGPFRGLAGLARVRPA